MFQDFYNVMEKRSLKLKLKIGNSSTPEPPAETESKNSLDPDAMAEDDPALGSDEDVEEEEYPEDGQVITIYICSPIIIFMC